MRYLIIDKSVLIELHGLADAPSMLIDVSFTPNQHQLIEPSKFIWFEANHEHHPLSVNT